MDCCGSGYDEVFTERQARWLRRRYDRHGLDRPTQAMVELAEARGLQGITVLEIGGGIGELQVELLRRGASSVTNVELTRSWDDEALRLLREQGLQDRVTRVLGDLVADPGLAGEADLVVLNRVVCCYPDVEGLLSAAASRARRTLVFSYPPRNAAVRAGLAMVNAWERFKGRDYRAFAHPPTVMHDVLGGLGLRPFARTSRGLWQVSALERVPTLERAT